MASGIEITVLVEFQAKDDDEADEREERLEQFFAETLIRHLPRWVDDVSIQGMEQVEISDEDDEDEDFDDEDEDFDGEEGDFDGERR